MWETYASRWIGAPSSWKKSLSKSSRSINGGIATSKTSLKDYFILMKWKVALNWRIKRYYRVFQSSFWWKVLVKISNLKMNKKFVKLNGDLHCLAKDFEIFAVQYLLEHLVFTYSLYLSALKPIGCSPGGPGTWAS